MANEESSAAAEAIAAGADPSIVAEMEKAGELASDDSKVETPAEHAPSDDDAARDDKGLDDAAAGADSGEKGKVEDVKKEDEDESSHQPDRTPKHVPVWKLKEELKQQEEKLRSEFASKETDFQKQISELSQKPGGATDAEIAKLAEDFNLEPEAASAMVDRIASIVESRTGLSDIRKDNEERKKQDQQVAEEKGFDSEFSDTSTQAALEEIAAGRPITAEVRGKVKELAYTTTYAKYRLADIIKLEAASLFGEAPATEHRSAEISRGGSGRGTASKSLAEMSPDEVNTLSDEEFLKLSNELGSGGSRFTSSNKKK